MNERGEIAGTARDFAARAEAERRAGRLESARGIAEAGVAAQPANAPGQVTLALVLIDSGDLVSAHRALERAFEALGGVVVEAVVAAEPAVATSGQRAAFATLADSELENAFDAAEAQPDEMIDANHMAAAALRLVEDGEPEGVDLASEQSPFATETVAGLLERQGHATRAADVRSAARERGRRQGSRIDDAQRERVVATLSRWLENLRRRTA